MADPEKNRLARRLKLLEDALVDTIDPNHRRVLRDELLEVHRQFDHTAVRAGQGLEEREDETSPPYSGPEQAGDEVDPFTAGGYQRYFDGQRWGDATHPTGGPTLDSFGVTEDQRTSVTSAAETLPASDAPLDSDSTTNRAAVAGFVLGLLSVFLYEIGILPILAVVVSLIGLGTYRSGEQSGQWMAVVGLILGVLFTLMYLVAYGHIVL